MRRLRVACAVLAAALTLAVAVPQAFAYFTARTASDGSVPLVLGATTGMNDTYADLAKTVSVTNTEGAPVWVRVQVFVGQTYRDKVAVTPASGAWASQGAWYVCTTPLAAGQTTPPITIDISGVPAEALGEDPASFGVAVVYETCPVVWNADGVPAAPDWSAPLEVASEGGEE